MPRIQMKCGCGWESDPFVPSCKPAVGGTIIYKCNDCGEILGVQEALAPELSIVQ